MIVRFALLAILGAVLIAAPNSLRPLVCFAAVFVLCAAFVELWRDSSRMARRRAILSEQIRGYAAAGASRPRLTGRRLG